MLVRTSFPGRLATLAVVVAVAAGLVAGCSGDDKGSSSAKKSTTTTTAQKSSVTTTTAKPAGGTTTTAKATTTTTTRPRSTTTRPRGTTTTTLPSRPKIVVTDADNGTNGFLKVGDLFVVQLPSSDWQIAESSAPNIIAAAATEVSTPDPGCTGKNCGQATRNFKAKSTGKATLTATRACPKGQQCSAKDTAFSVSLVVR